MKFGLIMTVCCRNPMQEMAWTSAREHTRPETPFYVLFNGIDPWPLPDGIQTLHAGEAFTDEADIWNYGLQLAIQNQWDWFVFVHDDFRMMAPGWEASLEQSEGWRVALAGWFLYRRFSDEEIGQYPTPGPIGTCIDPLSIGFKTGIFAERGYVIYPEFQFGFGAWDLNCWLLSEGYAIWRIPLDSWHHWIPNQNSRSMVHKGADGHRMVMDRWKERVLPADVIDGGLSIIVRDRKFRIAPPEIEFISVPASQALSTGATYAMGEITAVGKSE